MNEPFNRKLIIEDGTEYYGYGFGANCDKITEIVFNTSMVGYQEIISDPSYTYQTVVMNYPLIGNYGINDDDFESLVPTIGGLVVREYNNLFSNFRSKANLDSIMKQYNIVGISGVDTRKLVRSIRDFGSRRCLITTLNTTKEQGINIIKSTPILTDAVKTVSRKTIETFGNGSINIVAFDCGIKQNIVRSLIKRGCSVTLIPHDTPLTTVEGLKPDGIVLSNGPGDPTDNAKLIEVVKKLIGKYPILGICLGHQILSLAYGAKTYKLKFGHRGGNHPVKNLANGKIEITSQNHSFAVDLKSICNTPLTVTHINLLDQTVEGVECLKDKAFSVQYHPESCPGPEDSGYLFDKFINIIKENSNA